MARKLLAVNSVLLFAGSLTWFYLFYGVYTQGGHIISEPVATILGLELIGVLLITGFALFSMIYAAKLKEG